MLGRPRSTDDIDIIVDAPGGRAVYENVRRCGFEPLGIRDVIDVEFQTASIRFYKPPRYLPNFEVKSPRGPAQLYALRNKIAMCLGDYAYFISPIELQIAYKLRLGAERDVEDAVFLYHYAAEKGILNLEELQTWARRLGANLSRLREKLEAQLEGPSPLREARRRRRPRLLEILRRIYQRHL